MLQATVQEKDESSSILQSKLDLAEAAAQVGFLVVILPLVGPVVAHPLSFFAVRCDCVLQVSRAVTECYTHTHHKGVITCLVSDAHIFQCQLVTILDFLH